jgi:hypothetical protein
MKTNYRGRFSNQRGISGRCLPRLCITGLFLLLILIQASCVFFYSNNDELQKTKTALSLAQTQVSLTILQRTATANTQTLITPSNPPTSTTETPDEATPLPITPSPILETTPTEKTDLVDLMRSANILLYEDMVENRDTKRYIKETLESMELPFVDVGSAEGWLKSSLIGGPADGGDWDLIIIASEAKPGVTGEFFEYVNNSLDDGASVILEIWYLDKVANGTASSLLDRCGVEFQSDWRKIHPSRMVMFSLAATHPILNQPNSGISFTDTTSYWWDPSGENEYDIGDRMKLTFNGDALLLLGTSAEDKNRNGTVTNCINNRLILQTFSSHQLTFDTMKLLWENYIYNALKVRLLGEL